ncbi:hypothetical protein SGPA1_50370 [Streptomyces misionensis JCM 4497]
MRPPGVIQVMSASWIPVHVAYPLYLSCGHEDGRPALLPAHQTAPRRRPGLRPRQAGRPRPQLRGRHPPHRGGAGRCRRGVAHPRAGGAAAAGGRGPDPALPQEGRPGPARLRAGDLRRGGDPAAGGGVRRPQGRTRPAGAGGAAGRAAGAAEGAGRLG